MRHKLPEVIHGGTHRDQRGSIRFINDFDMSVVKRFYIITNANCEVRRGWRGHRIEQRWFVASTGTFSVKIVRIDDWEKPDKDGDVLTYILDQSDFSVLHIPEGHATLVQALTVNASLLVFADHPVEHSAFDDYLYDVDHFVS